MVPAACCRNAALVRGGGAVPPASRLSVSFGALQFLGCCLALKRAALQVLRQRVGRGPAQPLGEVFIS